MFRVIRGYTVYRGSHTEIFPSENVDFAKVAVGRVNSTGLPPSPTWGTRTGRPSETHN